MAESISIHNSRSFNEDPAVIAPQAIAVASAVVLVVMRIYVRASMRRLWWDDLMILIGLVLAISMLCSLLVGIHFGIGKHKYDLSPDELSAATKWIYIPRTEFVLAAMFTRLSIACFLLHIFAVDRKWRWSLYLMMGFIVLTSLPSALVILVAQCQPTKKVWAPQSPGKCWDPGTLVAIGLTFNGVIAIMTDLTLACMPIVFLWKVQMTFRAKLGICCLMGLGSLSTACAVVRTVKASAINNKDTTYRVLPLTVWATLEVTIGIIAACVPAIKPLFNRPAGERRSRCFRNRISITTPQKEASCSNLCQSIPDSYAANQVLRPHDGNQLEDSGYGTPPDSTDEENPPSVPEIHRIRKTTEFCLTSDKASAREQKDSKYNWVFDGRYDT